MTHSSESFRRLLRLLQEHHDEEIAALMQEIARLQAGKNERTFETINNQDTFQLDSISKPALGQETHFEDRLSRDQSAASSQSGNGCTQGAQHGLEVAVGQKTTSTVKLGLIDIVFEDEDVDHPVDLAPQAAARFRGPPQAIRPDDPLPVEIDDVDPVLMETEELTMKAEVSLKSVSATSSSCDTPQNGIVPHVKARPDGSATQREKKSFLRMKSTGTIDSCATGSVSNAGKRNKMERFRLLHIWHDTHKIYMQQVGTQGRRRAGSFCHHESVVETSGRSHCCADLMDKFLQPCMIDPGTTSRTAWSLAGVFFLCYDIVIVPPECFIGFPRTSFTAAMEWATRIFWTLDLPINLVTGVYGGSGLELRPSFVFASYLRTWFLLDITLVGSDWFSLGSEATGSADFLPLLRAFRFLRMLRLLRIAKLKNLVGDLLALAPDIIVGCAGVLKMAVVLCVLVHIFSCVWFAIGTLSQGWVTTSDLVSAPFGLKYLRALYWTITRLHAASTDEPREVIEYAFATLMVIFGFVSMALFVGKIAHTVTSLADARSCQMKQICRKYLRTRKVSAKLQIRLNKYLTKCHQKTFKEEVEHESEMLLSLPELLRTDLNEEVRKPIIMQVVFFREIYDLNPRMVRMLCFEAITGVVATKPECIFEYGILGTRMLWVESGSLIYTLVEDAEKGGIMPPRYSTRTALPNALAHVLTRGAFLSEAALWTEWFHRGQLVAESDVTILALEVSKFLPVIMRIVTCVTLTVNYARHYLANLNNYVQMEDDLSDMTVFQLDFSTIYEAPDDEKLADSEHLLFLSHFKLEAGTEAALMEGELEKMIRDDQSNPACNYACPCFLDSSDLIDLSGLKDHVCNSHNLVVLLTSNILTRPWCLVEIVTAVRSKVNLVPVEIQRPGLKFVFPDERFYDDLSRGAKLSREASDLLKEEGIELAELAACVRQVFLKIAVPFSPHKSTTVRKAELADILARCVFRGDDLDDKALVEVSEISSGDSSLR